MEIKIKKFDDLLTGELYSILRLRAEVFVVEQDCPYQDLDNLDQDAVHAFTMDNGSVVSYLRAFLKEGGTAQIGRVVTDKKYRGKGISLSLLKTAVQIAREHFCAQRIILHSQTYAMGFYAKVGFKAVGEEFLEDGIPHKEMVLEL